MFFARVQLRVMRNVLLADEGRGSGVDERRTITDAQTPGELERPSWNRQ